MRNLSRINNYYNKIAARQDWAAIQAFAVANGYGDTATKLQPPEGAGWRTIDKRIRKLRQIMAENGLTAPASPSAGDAFMEAFVK